MENLAKESLYHPSATEGICAHAAAQGESGDQTFTRYKKEMSAENIKLMTNSVNDIQIDIKVQEHKCESLTSFQYL